MNNVAEIKRYLKVIRRSCDLIEELLKAENPFKSHVEQQLVDSTEPLVQSLSRDKYVADLMAMQNWPEAVPAFLVGKDNSEEDQINRANAVLDMILDRRIDDLSVLDFGCGDGWIAQQAVRRGALEVAGYDIKLSPVWEGLDGPMFTTDFSQIKKLHYDIVIIYDVLDHADDPLGIMAQVRTVLKKGGVVYVRCHPWTSRHGTHLYKQGINRAYFHLFLQPEEIAKLTGIPAMFTRREKNAIEAYRWWLHDYDIKKERVVKEPVDGFFHTSTIRELLAIEQQIPSADAGKMLQRMEIQFVDYVLGERP